MDYALVSVRRGSSRLPDKCFLELGHQTVLGYVINRCMMFGFSPVVVTTMLDEDTRTCVEARRAGAQVVRGPVKDKLSRWKIACDKLNIDEFITVDADDPFFDPELSRLSLGLVRKGSDAVLPDMRAYIGSHGYSMSSDALGMTCMLKQTDDTEMAWHHFPETLKSATVDACPRPIESDIRLTLDYEEDYWLIRTVCREIGMWPTRRDIIEFFEVHPGLCSINRFRNADWKRRQAR